MVTFLGMDVDRVGDFTGRLRAGADLVDDAHYYVTQAELLADLPVVCAPALHDIAHDFGRLADRIDWAADQLKNMRLSFARVFDWRDVPHPVRTPVPVPGTTVTSTSLEVHAAQWDAVPTHPWDQVHQLSSHNSYHVRGGVQVVFDQGVRSFELDVHHQPAGEVFAPLEPGLVSPWLGAGSVDERVLPRWHVYHELGVSFREYEVLSEGLVAVAALDTADPLTIFIDMKDGFDDVHTADAFDQVLLDALGTRLYTPAMFQSRAGESATLLDAAKRQGWPQVAELQNHIIVVITDEIDGYARPNAQAFIAPPPVFVEVQGAVQHVPQPDAVFYNANARRVGPAEIAAVHTTDTLLRTYFNPRCATSFLGEVAANAHYRAVDIAVSDPTCGPSTLARPVGAPGPG